MKLDSRIIEGKKPLDCFDIDKAEQFIGKKGYFCDHISWFTDISNLLEDVLRDITPDEKDCKVYKTNCTSWEYFLPEEWVKEPENLKYVPYTLDTWQTEFGPGDIVFFRGKKDTCKDGTLYKCMYLGYLEKDNRILVILGSWLFSFDELFKLYEINRIGRWEPLGRKVETIDP